MDAFPGIWELNVSPWAVGARLTVAVIIGGILGWERELKKKPAGLRTYMLVSLGAACFMIIGLEMIQAGSGAHDQAPVDPSRVIQGIVGGIGFLGAGSIMQSRGEVGGITTAAGIWVVGGIGAACGAGFFVIAAFTSALALVIMTVLRMVETRVIHPRSNSQGSNSPPPSRE